MDYESDSVFPTDKTGRDAEVRNMFRQGKVIDRLVDDTQVSVRVQFLDKQQLISKFIPVKQFGSRSTSNFWCPKIGDDVSVTMLPNSNGSDGFVDGSFYNTGNPPPITDPDTRHIRYADGTTMEYMEGTTDSTASRAARQGTLTITTVGPIHIKCSGSCTIDAGGVMTLIAPNIILRGNVRVEGPLHATGDITSDGSIIDSASNTPHHSH